MHIVKNNRNSCAYKRISFKRILCIFRGFDENRWNSFICLYCRPGRLIVKFRKLGSEYVSISYGKQIKIITRKKSIILVWKYVTAKLSVSVKFVFVGKVAY